MNINCQVLLGAVLLVAFISVVDGIKCVSCSNGAKGCVKGTDKNLRTDCGKGTKCVQYTTTFSEDEKEVYHDRSCEKRPLQDGCEVKESYLGYQYEICVCSDKDYCNSSTSSAASGLLILSMACISMRWLN